MTGVQTCALSDLNSNDLLNVSRIDTDVLTIGGSVVIPGEFTSLPPLSVGTAELVDGSVTTVKIVDGAVTTSKIPDGDITEAKLSSSFTMSTVRYAATRATLKGFNTVTIKMVILGEGNRGGVFQWQDGDFAARIAADPREGIYIKADSVSSGLGAWVRSLSNYVSPKFWGAAADNTTDDFLPLNDAWNHVLPMFVDGFYKTSGTLSNTSSASKHVYGSGITSSIVTTTSANGDIFYKSGGSVRFENMVVTTTLQRASGAAIHTTGSTSKDHITNCIIRGNSPTERLFVGVFLEEGLICNITFNYFLNCNAPLDLRNTNGSGTGGEDVIGWNTFNTGEASPTTRIAVNWTSGLGTLRFYGNTIQSYGYGLNVSLISGQTTSSLICQGNAFESNATTSINLSLPAASTATMQTCLIQNNRIRNGATGNCFVAVGATNTAWIRDIIFTGNDLEFGVTNAVNIQAGATLTEGENHYRSSVTGLTALVTGAAVPAAGHLGSPAKNYVASTGSLTAWQLNGNAGFTKPTVVASSTAP